jgi:hypothetical protein
VNFTTLGYSSNSYPGGKSYCPRLNGLKLKMHLELDSAGRFYAELVSKVGEAVGIADGEPYWNGYLGQWQVWVNYADECMSVVCDWLAV